MEREKPRDFNEFWPSYVFEHRNPKNRRLHFIGSSLGLILLLAAIVTKTPWFVLGALVVGYAFAWLGHFFVEHNRPATFRYPFYSFIGDWKMYVFILTGKMDAEVDRVVKDPNRKSF